MEYKTNPGLIGAHYRPITLFSHLNKTQSYKKCIFVPQAKIIKTFITLLQTDKQVGNCINWLFPVVYAINTPFLTVAAVNIPGNLEGRGRWGWGLLSVLHQSTYSVVVQETFLPRCFSTTEMLILCYLGQATLHTVSLHYITTLPTLSKYTKHNALHCPS